MRFCRIFAALVLAAAIGTPEAYAADGFPNKPVRIIVPFAPGGPPDIIARLFAQKLSERWGSQAYVENMPGGNGNPGYSRAAKAPADGYTLISMSPGFTVNASLYRQLPFDPVKDFQAVTLVAGSPNVVVVHPSVPASNMNELIALIQKEPSKFSYGHPSSGTIPHLLGEALKQRYRLDLVTVPFAGAGAAITSAIGGHTPIVIAAVPGAKSAIMGGNVRALAVTSATRSQALPDVPTMQEAGLDDMEGETLSGFLVPARTPTTIVARLHNDISWALQQPDLRGRLAELGFEPKGDGPEKYQAKINSEIAKWRAVVDATGIPKLD
jgi:tripartite-type tricarboxylate transporter receptor subunit TctC